MTDYQGRSGAPRLRPATDCTETWRQAEAVEEDEKAGAERAEDAIADTARRVASHIERVVLLEKQIAVLQASAAVDDEASDYEHVEPATDCTETWRQAEAVTVAAVVARLRELAADCTQYGYQKVYSQRALEDAANDIERGDWKQP